MAGKLASTNDNIKVLGLGLLPDENNRISQEQIKDKLVKEVPEVEPLLAKVECIPLIPSKTSPPKGGGTTKSTQDIPILLNCKNTENIIEIGKKIRDTKLRTPIHYDRDVFPAIGRIRDVVQKSSLINGDKLDKALIRILPSRNVNTNNVKVEVKAKKEDPWNFLGAVAIPPPMSYKSRYLSIPDEFFLLDMFELEKKITIPWIDITEADKFFRKSRPRKVSRSNSTSSVVEPEKEKSLLKA